MAGTKIDDSQIRSNKLDSLVLNTSNIKKPVNTMAELPVSGADGEQILVKSEMIYYIYNAGNSIWLPMRPSHNASDMQIATTNQIVVSSMTPAVQGNFYVTVYYRVTGDTTSVTLDVAYQDSGGAQVINLVAGGQVVGSYTVVPIMINALPAAPIEIKVITSTSNNVFISTNIATI